MGNNTLCCSTQEFKSSSKMSLQPRQIAHASFCGCQINLSQCKLLHEDADTIVVIINKKLKVGQDLEEQLKKLGGQSIINELRQIRLDEGGKLDLGQVVYTHAGGMKFDYIFYTVLPSCCDATMLITKHSYLEQSADFQPTESLQEGLKCQMDGLQIITEKLTDTQQTRERQNIYECVINCLQLASDLGVKSIAFPVLEPFNGHISKSKIAAIMLFAIKQFLKDNANNSIEEIKISSQDVQTINLFKYIIHSIMNDNSETTIDRKNRQTFKNNYIKESNSLLSSEYDEAEEEIEQQMKVDNIMKFCHGYKDGNDENKVKCSF